MGSTRPSGQAYFNSRPKQWNLYTTHVLQFKLMGSVCFLTCHYPIIREHIDQSLYINTVYTTECLGSRSVTEDTPTDIMHKFNQSWSRNAPNQLLPKSVQTRAFNRHRGAQISHIFTSHFKFLDARHDAGPILEDPRILGATHKIQSSRIWAPLSKAIPLQAWTGPEGSRRLRFPDFKTIVTWRW